MFNHFISNIINALPGNLDSLGYVVIVIVAAIVALAHLLYSYKLKEKKEDNMHREKEKIISILSGQPPPFLISETPKGIIIQNFPSYSTQEKHPKGEKKKKEKKKKHKKSALH